MNAHLSPGTREGLEGSNCGRGLGRVTDVEEEEVEPQCLLMIQVEGVEPLSLLMIQVEEEEEEGGVGLRRHRHHSELRFHLLGEELRWW